MTRHANRKKRVSSNLVVGLAAGFMIVLLSLSGYSSAFPIFFDPGGGTVTTPRYAVIVHGIFGKSADMTVIRDEISSIYGGTGNILMVDYYSSNIITGEYNVFTPIGPFKDSNNIWRVSPSSKSLANYVQQQIKNWLSSKPDVTSPAGYVDIIAHSMGGLVVKSMLTDYFNDGNIVAGGKTFKIRKIITLGTPHQGSTMAKFAEMVYNLVLDGFFKATDLVTMRETLRAYITLLDTGFPSWLIEKTLDGIEYLAKNILKIDLSTQLQDIYYNAMYSMGLQRSTAEALLDYTGITQIQMMIPGHSFLKHINKDTTPGPASVTWYSFVGTYQYTNIYGVEVPNEILEFAFKLIPATETITASVKIGDIPMFLPSNIRISYPHSTGNYKMDVGYKVSWGLFSPDENWVSYTVTYWPENDGFVNAFSARNPGSSIYTFSSNNHYTIYAGSNSLSTMSSILA